MIINPYIFGHHPTYQAVLNRATALGYSLPSTAQQRKHNLMVVKLINAGAWPLLDLFYVPLNDSGSNFSRINWKDPSNFLLTLNGSITHTSNQGYVGATASYINTGWNPSTNGVNYTQNSASVFAYSFNDFAQTNNALFGWQGAASAGRTILDPENGDGTVTWQVNQTGILAAAGSNTNSAGFYHLDRSASNLQELYHDASLLLSDSAGTSGIANVDAYLLAANNNGTDAAHGVTRILSLFATGGSMQSIVSAVDTIISEYIDNP